MEKSKINFIVDALLGVFFIVTAFTGILIAFFIPKYVPHGGYQQLFGVMKRTWVEMHEWSGSLLMILIFVHLLLHRKWIQNMIKSVSKKRTDRE